MSDAILQARTATALGRAAAWLWSMQVPGMAKGVLKTSAAHDTLRWPGVLLPATYDGVMALGLLGELDRLSGPEKDALAAFLLAYRCPDGTFANPQMDPADTFKKPDPEETARYVAFHLTNYSLGALDALGRLGRPALDFVTPFLEPLFLEAWLGRRDLRDPWQEGNNIVNLASFLLLILRDPADPRVPAARRALDVLIDWHHRHQEPATGFWGVGQTTPLGHLHAMAGATHNLHIFWELEAPLAYLEPMQDYCLTLPVSVTTACLDVDPIDVIVHIDRMTGYRRDDAHAWLRAKLDSLLAFQNADGGFADTAAGTRRFDGWVRGYEEPQGLSNTFGTFFRTAAIAMIADQLWPGWRRLTFRKMIGIGYLCHRRPHP